MTLPTMFIASSKEGLEIAQAVKRRLKGVVESTIWDEGFFDLSKGYLESLVNKLDDFDFAALVLTPDDVIRSRGRSSQSPRDNVLFECGLFMGRLGRDRIFIIYDETKGIKIPSDLAGIAHATFKGDGNYKKLESAVEDACYPIRVATRELGIRQRKLQNQATPSGQEYRGFTDYEDSAEFRRKYRVVAYLARFVERRLIELGGEMRLITPEPKNKFQKLGLRFKENSWWIDSDTENIYLHVHTEKENHHLFAQFSVPYDWGHSDSWKFAKQIADELLSQLEKAVKWKLGTKL